jgi:glycosyltransferase involved in cell wall biosynthesis
MKIVFLAPFGIRPKGTLLARMLPLAFELQNAGHEVAIVAPPYTNPEDSGRVEIVRGVRIVNVCLPKGGKTRAALPLAWRMFRVALAEKPDIVHLFKPKGYGGLAAMLILSLQKIGFRLPHLFVDSDDWEGKGGMNELHNYSAPERWLYVFQEKWLLSNAYGVTVASRELESLVRGLGVAAARILYLPNCVEPVRPGDGRLVRNRLVINSTASVVLLYTRFFEFSQERLYSLFREICRQRPDVIILVIGKGRKSEEDALISDSIQHGYRNALVMAGWVEPDDLPDYLAAADVAVYPMDDNLINRAKCPAKLTEILLAGLPVVADAVGQVKEYIRDGESGLLSNPKDSQGMADAVVTLLATPEKCHDVGNAGRQYIMESYSWPQWVSGLDNFYVVNRI